MTRIEAVRAAPSPCICIVDDDPVVRHAMATLFAACGYACRAFDSGEALLAWPRPGEFALAVFDVRLPGLDGFALAERMARRCPALPLVFVSGMIDSATRAAAQDAGALALLPKPVDPERLLEAVERALGTPGDAS